jgi:CheY-like chemotaxis protein
MPKSAPRTVRSVLVADDDVGQANALSQLLRIEGFDVSTATSGPQALLLAGRLSPDAIVLDVGMPGMSGIQVAREVLERGYGEGARLIALTGYDDEIDRLATSQAGFHFHLSKPVDVMALLTALRQRLSDS